MLVNKRRQPLLINFGAGLAGYRRLSLAPVIGRYITWLKAALAMHFRMSLCEASGAFAIEFVGIFSADGFYLTAHESDYRILITPGGEFFVNYTLLFTIASEDRGFMGDGKKHSLLLSRDSNNILTIHIDNNQVGSANRLLPVKFTTVCAQWGGSTAVPNFAGALLSMHCIHGVSQEGNAKGNPHYRFDNNYLIEGNHSSVVENVNADIAPDILNVVLSSGWQDNGNGNWEVTQSYKSYLLLGGESGKSYILTYKDNSGIRANNGNSVNTPDGMTNVLILSGTTAPRLVGALGGSITLISLKEAPGCAEAVNINNSNTEYFEEQGDGKLLGEEMAVNSPLVFDGSENNYAVKFWGDKAVENGAKYKVEVKNNITSGELQANLTGKYWAGYSVPYFSLDGYIADHNDRIYTQTNAEPKRGIGSSEVSLRRIIE
jgi:hypothetical protein